MLHFFWDWFYLLTFSCSLLLITVNACLNYEINIYIFSVIFLSNFKYFLIKLLNLIKDDHRHALNADVLYYLLNIELSDILYISIIFKVFKVVFIVCFIKQKWEFSNVKLTRQYTVASIPNLGCLLGMDAVCGDWSDLEMWNFSFFVFSLIREPKYLWLFSTYGFCIHS